MKKFDQVGTWLNGEEIFYLNRIIEHKRLAKGLKEIVVPVLRILLKYGVRIDYVSGGCGPLILVCPKARGFLKKLIVKSQRFLKTIRK